MHMYFERIDTLGEQAEEFAEEIPTDMNEAELQQDGIASSYAAIYMEHLRWIEALKQETEYGATLPLSD